MPEDHHRQNLFHCPLCGSQAQFETFTSRTTELHGFVDKTEYRLWCTCHDCGVEMRAGSGTQLIERWNRRATPSWINYKDRKPDSTLPVFLEDNNRVIYILARGIVKLDEHIPDIGSILLRRYPELFRWMPIPGHRKGE
jgi:hypothetical protein